MYERHLDPTTIVADSELEKTTTLIREVIISYRGNDRSLPTPVRTPPDAVKFLRKKIQNNAREHFVAIFLDGRHQPIAYQIVSIGTAIASLVHPREIFQPAIALGAAGIILAHNHPSGDVHPSREDAEITQRLVTAGQILGIHILDHIVFGEDEFYSLRENQDELFAEITPAKIL